VRRIEAFDIQRRICFRISLALGFSQGDLKCAAVVGDLGQNVIAGPVQDPDHRRDVVSHQGLAD